VAEIRSPDHAPDVVVAQIPPARTPGSRVALLVNRGQDGASYVMPDLIGVNGDRAAEILRGHGFRVAVVASNPYPGVAAGIVLRQSPQGGFRIAPGEPISLEVSR
jgi:serine/threonine-protein kinase